jgi:Tfp pilus assembly protein PilF
MNELSDRALELWREGTARLLAGDLDQAIALFTRSLETLPTAEAYTFRGWAYSFAGRLDDAIVECQKAIATDPEFGNPYNDIGCYLMEQGRWDEAIPWFGQAKTAARYEPRHFPYLNLGRLRAARGEVACTCSKRSATRSTDRKRLGISGPRQPVFRGG